MTDDGAANGDALALAAGQFLRPALHQWAEFQDARGLIDLSRDLVLRHPGKTQRKAHVLAHVHMRVKCVGLEHHGDAPFGRIDVVHALTADLEFAGSDRLEAGDQAQQSRLAAT